MIRKYMFCMTFGSFMGGSRELGGCDEMGMGDGLVGCEDGEEMVFAL